MNTPLISIIIPAYNAQKYISATLDSILNQPCKDFEIIVVNDGSTDKTSEILSSYSSRNKQIVVLDQKNQGVSVARNNALEIAKGKYISFLDSDDLWADDFYNEQLRNKIIEKNSGMYAFDFFVANSKCEKGNIVGSKDRINDGDKFIFLWNHFASFIYSREMIIKNKIRFSVSQKIDEDNAFLFLNLCACKNVYPISRCGLIYRNNWNSVTHKINNICKEKLSVIILWNDLKTQVTENENLFSKEAVTMCDVKIAISLLDYISFAAKEGKEFEEIHNEVERFSGDEIIRESTNLNLPEHFSAIRNAYLNDSKAFVESQRRSFLKKCLNSMTALKKIYVDNRGYSLNIEEYLKSQKNI